MCSSSGSFSFIFTLFIFIGPFLSLSSSTPIHRRILHQPFQPEGGSPPPSVPPNPPPSPSPSPSPPNPKYPFSTTPTNNASTPFFPTYPSPPPPPSPSAFASFPANISSLILPQSSKSKSSSKKLAAVAIASVACALAVLALSAFVYFRRRRQSYSSDEKTLRSDSSIRLFPREASAAAGGGLKPRNTSSTSSEFLYLGTIVNSRGGGVDELSDPHAAALNPRKMDSPELQPLPPLARQTSRLREEAAATVEDDEEEFYSPRGSLNGREGSTGAGSGSRRVFSAIAGENLVGRSSSESTSSSYSTSSSASPDRSHSISLSPPVSISPRRSQPKSPENTIAHHSSSPPPEAIRRSPSLSSLSSPSSPSPVFGQHMPSSSMSSTPERRECQSPSLSPLSLSPRKIPNPDGGSPPGLVLLEKAQSFGSSKSKSDSGSPRLSNASSIGKSSAFSLPSPDKGMNLHHGLDQSPTISDVSDRFRHSPLSSLPLSPTLLSSPERELSPQPQPQPQPQPPPSRKHWEIPDLLTPIGETPIFSVPQRKQWEIPVLPVPIAPSSGSVLAPPAPTPPPPPPPPPPVPRQRKQWDMPVPSPVTPVGQQVSRPPALTPPSRPFVLQTPNTMVSPVELPPGSSQNFEESSDETSKPKLKPLHWDKVRASSDREMVWDHLRSSSFK